MIPIGHIALDLRPEQDATLPALPPGEDGDSNNKIVWVAGLFISYALQARGLGREAMYAVERLAAREDLLRAGWAVLDIMEREQQLGGGACTRPWGGRCPRWRRRIGMSDRAMWCLPLRRRYISGQARSRARK